MDIILELIAGIMPNAIIFTVLLFLTALGGMISERSGIVNIALEGLMLIGCFSTAVYINVISPKLGLGYGGVWIGLFVGALVSMIVSVLHAFASVTLNSDQVISGTAINLLAPAGTVFLARFLTGSGNISIQQGIRRTTVPILSEIPIIGNWFFTNAYATTLLAVVLAVGIWYLVFKTAFGLRLRACGEHPHAADSMGINVYKMRYFGVMASGFLAGLSGAMYITTISLQFNGDIAGLGFLALAALIFGKWKPITILGASFFFAFMKTLGAIAGSNPALDGINLPMEFYNILPYFMTIIALVLFSRNIVGPKAAGQPYDKGKR